MTAPAWFVRDLVEGDDGDDVLIVQRKLGAPMTGVMDQTTMARVRGFQRQHGLQETGMVKKKTAERIGEKASVGQKPAWFKRELGAGDSGVDVKELRVALKQPLLPDYFDSALEDAVRRFQASLGAKPTGRFDDDTAVALAARTA